RGFRVGFRREKTGDGAGLGFRFRVSWRWRRTHGFRLRVYEETASDLMETHARLSGRIGTRRQNAKRSDERFLTFGFGRLETGFTEIGASTEVRDWNVMRLSFDGGDGSGSA
uniref:Uncharacterized protein n=1 Tax=Cucumis melo TaxID=3656 RepID=A0A9I9E9I6_CUCME